MIFSYFVLQLEYGEISEVSEMYLYTNFIIGQQALVATLVLYALKYPYSKNNIIKKREGTFGLRVPSRLE